MLCTEVEKEIVSYNCSSEIKKKNYESRSNLNFTYTKKNCKKIIFPTYL